MARALRTMNVRHFYRTVSEAARRPFTEWSDAEAAVMRPLLEMQLEQERKTRHQNGARIG